MPPPVGAVASQMQIRRRRGGSQKKEILKTNSIGEDDGTETVEKGGFRRAAGRRSVCHSITLSLYSAVCESWESVYSSFY